MKFYLFGHGSIGTRHQKNLTALGHEEVAAIDRADCALICNPTSLHISTALTVPNLPLFIEKPLSYNLNNLDKLTGKILLGYCLRFDKSLQIFKQKIDGQPIKSAKIVCNSWLPDWRPGKDYRQTYSAKKALGGGVLLDLSHEIDYALWFFGTVKGINAKLQNSPELEIETEAIADLKLEFTSRVKTEIHLSYASRQSERYCEVITTSGETLRWDYQSNSQMYVDEMKHFIDVVEGKTEPLVTVTDGIKVLKIVEQAKKSKIS